jgi:hypothetical protein
MRMFSLGMCSREDAVEVSDEMIAHPAEKAGWHLKRTALAMPSSTTIRWALRMMLLQAQRSPKAVSSSIKAKSNST